MLRRRNPTNYGEGDEAYIFVDKKYDSIVVQFEGDTAMEYFLGRKIHFESGYGADMVSVHVEDIEDMDNLNQLVNLAKQELRAWGYKPVTKGPLAPLF